MKRSEVSDLKSATGKKSKQTPRGRGCYVHNKCDHPECKQANRDYQRVYMRFKRDGTGWVDPWIEEALK